MAAKAERKRSHLAKRQAPRTIEGERMAQTRGVVEVVEGGQGLNGRDPSSRRATADALGVVQLIERRRA